jgi:hypothetical protein
MLQDFFQRPAKRNLSIDWKNLIKILAFTLIIISCRNKGSEHKLTQKEKENGTSFMVEEDLSYQKEKIVLLSKIRNVGYDTLYAILKEYDIKTFDFSFSDSLPIISNATIYDLSAKYHLSEQHIAALIFSFKYEMQTKEEIVEEDKEEQEFNRDSYSDQQ